MNGVVAIRPARDSDARVLSTLAELDEDQNLCGEVLLALIDGEPIAAVSLGDGRVVANPFVATGDAVSLLELRARQLAGVVTGREKRRRLSIGTRLRAGV